MAGAVFLEMLRNDSEFRSRAKEAISREYGAQAAQGLENYISGE